MRRETSQTTVYFDGSCPLCAAEIGHYRRADGQGCLRLVDVSRPEEAPPAEVSRAQALARFHVRAADGRVLSGAAAFAEVWSRLPRWRWAARLARFPGALPALEAGYRLFLPVRPALSALAARAIGRRSKRGA